MNVAKNKGAQLSLPSDLEIAIMRDFRAPKALVFEAWTKAEHVKKWYACATLSMPSCEMDFRVGGLWRYVLRDPGGNDHTMSGEYREIERPNKLVFTERYEPIPGSDHLVTITLTEHEGTTTLKQLFHYPSKQSRDGHLQSGMDRGLDDTFERMDQVIETIQGSQS
jgi:uncharacterized protein YndB with AHSA1/START domain